MSELKRFGRYEIVRILGTGAMGVVYEGIDTKLNRRVAIKTIHKNALIDPEQAADYSTRFMREAQSVARLNHSNIVTVYDFGEEDEVAYFVMEFIQGSELKSFFDKETNFPLSQSLGLMIDLLDAMGYAHSQGIIHRDIKPANIMIDQYGKLKLTDFGVARVLDNTEGTQAGTIVGTPDYMSPEQIEGKAIGPGADIFAAGVVLYQFLTKYKPFNGTTAFDVQRKIVSDPPALPSVLNTNLPPFLDQIVNKALAKNAEQRYSSAAEFAKDLKQALAMGEIQKADDKTTADLSTIVNPSRQMDSDRAIADPSRKKASDKTIVDSSIQAQAGKSDSTTLGYQGDRRVRPRGDTIMCSVLFLDVVGYSKVSNKDQISLKKKFNELLSNAVVGIPSEDIIILDTGDGAAVNFLNDVEDALRSALHLREALFTEGAQMEPPLRVRMGINLGPGHLIEDINGRPNMVGDVINVAQRVMGFSAPGQILVSRSYYDAVGRLSYEYEGMFHQQGAHADKHLREHEVYAIGFPDDLSAALAEPEPEQPASPAITEQPVPSEEIPEEITKKPGWIASLFKGVLHFFKSLLKRIVHFIKALLSTIVGIIRLGIVVLIIIFIVTVISKFLLYAPSNMDSAEQLQGRAAGFFESAMQRLEPVFQAVGLGSKNANGEKERKKEVPSKAKVQHKNNSLPKENKDVVKSGEKIPDTTAGEASSPPAVP